MKAEHISKSFGEQKVLQDLTIDFPEGETTILMGPSGCGKTTLLRILMGLEEADTGNVDVPKCRMAAVFQENRLCEDFNAVENCRIVMDAEAEQKLAAAHGSKEKGKRIKVRQMREMLAEELEEVGLGEDAFRMIREFSGGMKRRTAIVRAVTADPDLLFLDEPFQGLDDASRELVISYLQKRTAGRTVILVTHDQRDQILGKKVIRLRN
ncbi:MAG: ATP-binding cassette domain-containing protein [Eubacteriales bacterium]|nr:ATP-binding cassette domain-containing protein [Eubacteriales bacterium]